jgi:hypothetical protein
MAISRDERTDCRRNRGDGEFSDEAPPLEAQLLEVGCGEGRVAH